MVGLRPVFVFTLATLLFLVSPALVYAQGEAASQERSDLSLSDPLALELKSRGDSAMLLGNYVAALDAYERASAIENHPKLLYNRARALQALQQYTKSLELFQDFKVSAPSSLLSRVPQLDSMIGSVRKNICFVYFQVAVSHARVKVRGRSVYQPTRGPHAFDAGPAEVVIEARGYESYSRKLQLNGGKRLTISPHLVELRREGTLQVDSSVAGAEVLVDGRSVGMVPAEVSLAPGNHQIQVRHPKFKTNNSRVLVEARLTRTIHVDLERRPSVWRKWWFWVSIGAATVAGATLAVILTTEKSPGEGDIPPGTIKVPGG